jgi:hypothetical protein
MGAGAFRWVALSVLIAAGVFAFVSGTLERSLVWTVVVGTVVGWLVLIVGLVIYLALQRLGRTGQCSR